MLLVGPAPAVTDDAATKKYVDDLQPHVTAVTLNFGAADAPVEDTTATATVPALWAAADSVIRVVPDPAGSADHPAVDTVVEQITAYVTAVSPGAGFTVTAYAPGGSWGRHQFLCIGR